jgi:hypothetical protein
MAKHLAPIELNPDYIEQGQVDQIMDTKIKTKGTHNKTSNSIGSSKQESYFTEESGSPRVKFNKSFLINGGT